MVLAYVRRDPVETGLVYEDGYQGLSLDLTSVLGDTLAFTKADEVAHVAFLGRLGSGSTVRCEVYPAPTRFRDNADPPGWATIQNPLGAIEIDNGQNVEQVNPNGITMDFKFAPTTPDTTSPTDTTWKIVRWLEVRN
jgi:hypothetical protein